MKDTAEGDGAVHRPGLWKLTLAASLLLVAWAAAPALAAPRVNPVPAKLTSADCLACHSDATLSKDVNGKAESLYVNETQFAGSIHGVLSCTDCHADVKAVPHESAPAKPNCSSCHAEQQASYDHGIHAQALKQGDGKAAGCMDCHGSPHGILAASDPKSQVHRSRIPATCGSCHGQKFVMAASGHSSQTYVSYQESVHGRAVAAGSKTAAVCTDCHNAHNILRASDPQSPIFKFNVPATCARCHGTAKAEYVQSIHGQAVARGNWQAPVCTDCHGIHSIKSHVDPQSSVAAQALARTTCARCHEGVRLSQEFSMPDRRATTYLESYHGLASKLGSNVVANCASCHGVHNILPSSDPRSTISRAHLVETCGKCHPGVTEKFALGKVHVDDPLSADFSSVAVRWVRQAYVGMILAVIGAMLLHNFLIWRRKAVERRRQTPDRVVVRMSGNQRAQHLVLLLSFFVLVITGFALKYPESWFAAGLGMGEKARGVLHRVAAAALIAAGCYHVLYLAITGEGRKLIRALVPVLHDARDLRDTMRYYLDGGVARPRYARFSYAEKMEYWALVWGMLVMASTGVMLWAKVTFGHFLPRWLFDVATAVHFYEAILATLAIVVWHFYQVFFDPDVYPMNWAWFDGKMSLHHYREEHALDPAIPLAASPAETVSVASGNSPEKEEEETGEQEEELTASRP